MKLKKTTTRTSSSQHKKLNENISIRSNVSTKQEKKINRIVECHTRGKTLHDARGSDREILPSDEPATGTQHTSQRAAKEPVTR